MQITLKDMAFDPTTKEVLLAMPQPVVVEMLLNLMSSEDEHCHRANNLEYDIKEFKVYLLKKLCYNNYEIKSDDYEKLMRDIINEYDKIVIKRNNLEGDD